MDDSKTKVKISDFGLSKNYFKEKLSQCVGSVLYVAPEILLSDSYDKQYGNNGLYVTMWICSF